MMEIGGAEYSVKVGEKADMFLVSEAWADSVELRFNNQKKIIKKER